MAIDAFLHNDLGSFWKIFKLAGTGDCQTDHIPFLNTEPDLDCSGGRNLEQ
jgi:hypothetical protein